MKKIKVYCGFISTGSSHSTQAYAMRDIEKLYSDKVEFVYPANFCSRIFHDYARNAAVEDFLKTDCDVLWFLDSDICPPTSVGEILTQHYDKWKVAGCPYPLFLTPEGHEMPKVTFAIYNDLGAGYNPAQLPQQGIDYVDGIATGCIFVKREVFEAMEKPYFEFTYDEKTRKMKMGEDISFARKVNSLGHRFFIDYAMVCHHYKTVDLLDVNNYAINEFNVRWAEYDRELRSQVAQVKLGLKKVKERSPIEIVSNLSSVPPHVAAVRPK